MDETLRNTVTADSGLSQFVTKYDNVTADEDLRQEYFNYVQGVWYIKGIKRSAKAEGREEGINIGMEKGMEKGISQTRLETARNLLDFGIDPEIVSKSTALPLETIRNLSTQQSKRV